MLLNIQFGASNIRGFNAEPSSQGPTIAEIRKVEVQKDASTQQTPAAPKGPQSSQEKKSESDEEEQTA